MSVTDCVPRVIRQIPIGPRHLLSALLPRRRRRRHDQRRPTVQQTHLKHRFVQYSTVL